MVEKIKCPHCKKEYYSSGIKSHIIWCKKNPNPNIKDQEIIRQKISKGNKGKIVSEETKKLHSIISKEWHKNNPEAMKGKNNPMFGKHHSEKTKQQIKNNKPDMSGEKSYWFGLKHSKKTRKLISDHHADMSGENNPMYGKIGENNPNYGRKYPEHSKKMSGEGNPNWNPDRAAVYAPYGPNFYSRILRQVRWELQSGRCLLSGNKLNPDVTHAYHHFDWDKSNDNPDNVGFVTGHFHGIVHSKRKKEYYKKILIQNLKDLKNGIAPKSWSEKNRLLYQQEMRVQTDLDDILRNK